MEWQPIETAPKDGTRVVGYGRNIFGDYVWACRYLRGYWALDGNDLSVNPIMWMPLPEPPTPSP